MIEGESRKRWGNLRNVIGVMAGVGTLAAIIAGRIASMPIVISVSTVAVVMIGISTKYQVDSSQERSNLALAPDITPPVVPSQPEHTTAAPVEQPATKPSVLVSFHPSDRAWARWITRQLSDFGYMAHSGSWPVRVLGDEAARPDDPSSVHSDDGRTHVLGEQFRDVDCLLLLVSRAYVTARADGHHWQRAMMALLSGRATDSDRPIILPVLVEPCDMDPDTAQLIAVDLTDLDAEGCKEEIVARLRQHQLPAPNPSAPTTQYPLPGRGPGISNLRASDAGFVGRRAELDALHELLNPDRSARTGPSAEPDAAVVYGLGGVGKTEFALQYAWEFADQYDLVWWVQAATPVTAINDLIDLAKALNLPERANHDETVINLWSTLRQRDRWLLVFDDADDPDSIRKSYWPATKRGHVLVTSRAATGWESLTSRGLELTPLTPHEAEDFFTRRIPEAAGDLRTTRRVATLLGYLPLALVQAATYIREAGTTLAAYHSLLVEQYDDVIGASQHKTNEVAGGSSLLSLLSAQNRAPAALDLLALLSMFGSTNIPRRIITEHADVLPPRLQATMADQLAHDRTVRELRRFSLIWAFTDRFNVHSVVQSMVRSALSPDDLRMWCRVAIRLLRRAFPRHPEEPVAWSACAFLMPHVEAATAIAERLGEKDERTAHLLLLAGRYLHGRCNWRRAQEFLRSSLEIRKQLFGENDLRVAECLYHLAQSQFTLADLPDARASAQQALRIREQLLEPTHPLIAEALTRLAEILREFATENEQAIAYTRRAEHILREVGANDDGIARTLLIRGTILRNEGRLGDALRAYEQSLALTEQVRANGPSSIEAAMVHANIGVVYRDRGQWERARDEFETAITIMEPVLGPEHIEVSQAKKYLGDIHWRTGDLSAAFDLLTQVTEVHRKRPGEEHKLASCLAKLGSIQLKRGENEQARTNLETAQGIYLRTYPAQHPYVAKVLSRLAPVYLAFGEQQKAEAALYRAQDILESCYGRNHPALVWVLRSLAEIHELRGDDAAADSLRVRAAAIRRRTKD